MPDLWHCAWAKTGQDPDDRTKVASWLPLHQHLADTAGVAALLVEHWVPSRVIDRLGADLGGDVDDVRIVTTWLAAVHDVGKISPAFVVQCKELTDAMRPHGLVANPRLAVDPHRAKARHELVGQAAVRTYLHERLGFGKRTEAAQFACVVGGHHGIPPDEGLPGWLRGRKDLAGDGIWSSARGQALEWATGLVGGPDALARYASRQLGRPSQALLSAIVIMADWIASNIELFPLQPLRTAFDPPSSPDPGATAARVKEGWSALDLPPRWTPQPSPDTATALAERFGRSPADVRPVQLAAVEAARAQPTPGLVVVEAPMGEGKTEAALLAAEVLAERSGADGLFIALPTRATTDAMFSRVHAWMQRLPGLPDDVSVMLAHGTAALNDRYRGLLRRGYLAGIGIDDQCDEVGIAHRWLNGRRKGALAQFVIGTIDQVLFGALKGRHLMLRHLALAGKVVVIDEVHAYDVYMARYLDRVLHWLGAYGTPVVLLSATLPAARRAELVHAYDSGRGSDPTDLSHDPGYPVVLASGLPPQAAPASGVPRTVALERLPDDDIVLVTRLREALADGGCAVVIRNTVRRVQEAANLLIAEFGEQNVTVAHSRFLACDRARLDQSLLDRFGPPGSARRPESLHIVVASQVVEQSLDIDFDLMITDLAPIDLVLQRMGRLHRHQRDRPTGLRQPHCLLTGVQDWAATPPRAVSGGRAVYGEHPLLRSAALLVDRDTVTLPIDIPALVQAAYGDTDLGPTNWQDAMRLAESAHDEKVARRRQRAGDFLLDEVGAADTLNGWVSAGVGDPEDEPRQGTGQVRDGEESIEVLVVQRDRDGGILTPDWLPIGGGVQIPTDSPIEADLARTIATCALRLPVEMSRMGAIGNSVIRALERNYYPSFATSPLLTGQLVLVLDDDRAAELREGPATFGLSYDPRRGLRVEAV